MNSIIQDILERLSGPIDLRSNLELYVLRRMQPDDIDEILRLEKIIFPVPWSRKIFEDELSNDSISLSLVVEREKEIVGYLICWINVSELHISNIAIAPQYRRRGISAAVLNKLLHVCESAGIQSLHLEVRKSNQPAIALYHKLGFEIVGIWQGYYQNNNEDALLMSKVIV